MRWLRSFLFIAVSIPATLVGQVTIGPEGPVRPEEERKPDRDQPQIVALTVTPAAEPVPALQYRFDVPPGEQRPGNSVPFYYRAVLSLNTGDSDERQRRLGDTYNKLAKVPMADFPVEEARQVLASYQTLLTELERAYVREETDWGWHMEELKGTEWISFLLEETQEAREIARLLYIKGRLELAEGRFEDAEQTLRMGFHLAGAAGEPPLLINKLVGVAIATMMNQLVQDWIGVAGSPNVYWAVAALPDPLINMRPALEYELGFPARFAPWLEDAATDHVPPAVWRGRFVSVLQELLGMSVRSFDRDLTALFITGLALQHYPVAKQALIERGYSPEEVEAMPVGQVIAIRQRHLNQIVADELLKQALVGPARAAEVGNQAAETLKERGLLGPPMLALAEPLPLMALLAPATEQAGWAARRLEAKFAGVRTLEAIRMHAAETGQFPKSLDEIEVVPVPDSPFTGQPFEYSLKGDTAVLIMVIDPRTPSVNSRFEITLESPKQ